MLESPWPRETPLRPLHGPHRASPTPPPSTCAYVGRLYTTASSEARSWCRPPPTRPRPCSFPSAPRWTRQCPAPQSPLVPQRSACWAPRHPLRLAARPRLRRPWVHRQWSRSGTLRCLVAPLECPHAPPPRFWRPPIFRTTTATCAQCTCVGGEGSGIPSVHAPPPPPPSHTLPSPWPVMSLKGCRERHWLWKVQIGGVGGR